MASASEGLTSTVALLDPPAGVENPTGWDAANADLGVMG